MANTAKLLGCLMQDTGYLVDQIHCIGKTLMKKVGLNGNKEKQTGLP